MVVGKVRTVSQLTVQFDAAPLRGVFLREHVLAKNPMLSRICKCAWLIVPIHIFKRRGADRRFPLSSALSLPLVLSLFLSLILSPCLSYTNPRSLSLALSLSLSLPSPLSLSLSLSLSRVFSLSLLLWCLQEASTHDSEISKERENINPRTHVRFCHFYFRNAGRAAASQLDLL